MPHPLHPSAYRLDTDAPALYLDATTVLLDSGADKDAPADMAPPTEVVLFPFGQIKTRKGTFRFTEESAKLVKAQWERYGRDFGFDYGHATFKKDRPDEEKISAGWGKLAIRPGVGLVCTGIHWTEPAARKISKREFRYLSPAFNAMPKTGVIVAVENCALTNIPATLDPTPLLLQALGGEDAAQERIRELSMETADAAGYPTSPSAGGNVSAAGVNHLPKDKTAPAAKELRTMTADPKMMELGKSAVKGLGYCLSVAQKMADSADESLKTVGKKLADSLAEHLESVKLAFPGLPEEELTADPPFGGKETPSEEAAEEKAKAKDALAKLTVLEAAVERVTGVKEGHAGAVLALKAQLDAKVEQVEETVQLSAAEREKAALVEKMISETRQVEESEREVFLQLSMADLQSFHQTAPHDRKLRATSKAPILATAAVRAAGTAGQGGDAKARAALRAEAKTALIQLGCSEEEAEHQLSLQFS
mgnify:CR=1 FL=1